MLAGGYEDDVDHGDEFYYTGAGGRDLSGNKRTAPQSKDQELNRTNLALAKNCFGKQLNKCKSCTMEKMCESCANQWQKGKALRVCRSYKNKGEFSPAEGVRYDGIYKVVDYWFEKGKSGFKVIRYRMRRDDPEPAPWTSAGRALAQRLYEEGCEKYPKLDKSDKQTKAGNSDKTESGGESENENENGKEEEEENQPEEEKKNKKGEKNKKSKPKKEKEPAKKKKSKKENSKDVVEISDEENDKKKDNKKKEKKNLKRKNSKEEEKEENLKKKKKEEENSIDLLGIRLKYWKDAKVQELIAKDDQNARMWKEIKEVVETTNKISSDAEFLEKIQNDFSCPVCLELCSDPITTPCGHNFCRKCLNYAVKNQGKKKKFFPRKFQ